MKNFKVLALCALTAGMFYSCEKEESLTSETQPEISTEITKDEQIALAKAGINPQSAEYHTLVDLDGTTKKGILAGSEGYKDMFIAFDQLASMALPTDADANNKQYRTNSLVARNSIVNVVGYTGRCRDGRNCGLTPVMQEGLRRAVDNYNNIGISLRFTLSFTSDITGAEMIIFNPGGANAGGQAEFPSNGRPGRLIQIFGGMSRLDANTNEHVIAHEMGHALGFRHTDYARRRCDGSNEGSSFFGAIRIPGTPVENRWGFNGLDSNSIMISCFGQNEDGEFSNFDVVALRALY